MKLGISFNMYKNAYSRYSSSKFLKVSQNGFSCVDYNMADTETELYSLSYTELKKQMLSEKQEAADANIEISQVHGPWRWPPQDSTSELRQERMDKMKKSIMATEILGCKYWVIHPIMPFGTEDLKKSEDTFRLNIEFMSELLEFAKECDVVICLENMPMLDFSLATPEQILKFVEEINDEHFQICLDTGHVSVFPNLSVSESIRKLNKKIKVLHIHDNMGDRDVHMWPTRGIIDWKECVNALNEIGFSGSFSLETLPDESLNDENFEKECIKLNRVAKNILNGCE